ncbi:hypothetical protein ACHAWF_012279 [Thalassiosira exigua]
MDPYGNCRPHDNRPKSIAECYRPGEANIDFRKYQAYVAFQADKSRRRIAHLVQASYEEEKKHGRFDKSTSGEDGNPSATK